MRVTTLPVLVLAGYSAIACASGKHVADQREATVSATGATMVRITARAGDLKVLGRSGAETVEVQGTARASSDEALEAIRLIAERRGDVVWIEAEIDSDGFRSGHQSLDLVIELPDSIPVDATDSSGHLAAEDLASLELKDSSGDVRIDGIAGTLDVTDSSGTLDVSGVGGETRIHDSSGDLRVSSVDGTLRLHDSSGDIRVSDAKGDVIVERDSSGDIDVGGVDGDFVVERDGSGDIDYRDVGGEVRIPRKKR